MNPQAANGVTADQILQQINELPISLTTPPIPANAIQPKAPPGFIEKYGLWLLVGLVALAIVTKH